MEIAHFSMFHDQKHDFLTPPYCFNIEVFNNDSKFSQSAECHTTMFKHM